MVRNLHFFNYFVFRWGRMDYIWSSYIFVNRTDCWSCILSPIKYLSPSPYQHSSFSTSIFRKSRTSYSIVSHWRWAFSWSSCLSLLFLTGPVRKLGPSLHIWLLPLSPFQKTFYTISICDLLQLAKPIFFIVLKIFKCLPIFDF